MGRPPRLCREPGPPADARREELAKPRNDHIGFAQGSCRRAKSTDRSAAAAWADGKPPQRCGPIQRIDEKGDWLAPFASSFWPAIPFSQEPGHAKLSLIQYLTHHQLNCWQVPISQMLPREGIEKCRIHLHPVGEAADAARPGSGGRPGRATASAGRLKRCGLNGRELCAIRVQRARPPRRAAGYCRQQWRRRRRRRRVCRRRRLPLDLQEQPADRDQ